jgi:hypothetical protein
VDFGVATALKNERIGLRAYGAMRAVLKAWSNGVLLPLMQ